MPTHDTPWPAGTPCWVDLSADDAEASRAFYSSLFGWQIDVRPEFGGYGSAMLKGRTVAGIGPKMGGAPMPSVWTTYLATDDADAATRSIGEHGGQVVAEPMDVGELGRMAVAVDPTGAMFGVWQSAEHVGAQLVNEPGALVWSEQSSADLAAATAFYTQTFGFEAAGIAEAPDMKYATISVDGHMVGGLHQPDDAPAPARWLTYFAVGDTDAAVARVSELGGAVQREPWDSAYGRMAVVSGPEGETFALMQVPAEGYDHSDQPPA